LLRKCPSDAPRPIEMMGNRRYLRENPQEFLHFKPDLPTIGCWVIPLPLPLICNMHAYILLQAEAEDSKTKKEMVKTGQNHL